jgi:site-specific DNA recombinase
VRRPRPSGSSSVDILRCPAPTSWCANLKAKNICTKVRTSVSGKTHGGNPFGRGALTYFLRNRFFIGEVTYKSEILRGEQPAIIDKVLFEAVQQKLSINWSHKTQTRHKSDHLLRDFLFDDAGHLMVATHATKAGVRYRYYASRPSLRGEARTAQLGSVSRVPAAEIEQAIVFALRHIANQNLSSADRTDTLRLDHDMLNSLVSRIDVQKTQLVISLKSTEQSTESATLTVPWQKPPSKRSRRILLPHEWLENRLVRNAPSGAHALFLPSHVAANGSTSS